MKSDVNFVRKTGVIAAFAAVSFALTLIIRIPIPATDGYFNIGDSVIMFAALLFGPWVGLLVGALGPSLADAVGFPQFIFATAIVKGAEGFLVGLIGQMNRGASEGTTVLALGVGIVVLVGGYFVFEALIYPWLAKFAPFFDVTDFTAAVVEVLPNILQGVVSAAIAFGAWKVSRRAFPGAPDGVKATAD
jgi:uncharacterized membrane protein